MASQAASPATTLTAYPTTPYYADDVEWITAYLDIHVLSDASMVYAYLLWIALAIIVVTFAALHLAGMRGGYLGAYWTKWSVRRRTWRKKHALAEAKRRGDPHRQPLPLPSNAQLLTLTFIVCATLALAFIGPDYFAPGAMLWNVKDTPVAHLRQRAPDPSSLTQYLPDYTIGKAWWTSGNRTGLIAFALFPLCVLLALKAPPFAVLSLSFVVQLYFDKLSWLHKWTGRLIWFFSALHVALWSVQLSVERRDSTGKMVYIYAWDFRNFIYGWIAFGFLTLLIALSLRPIRQYHYEAFYFLHVLLVPLTLIFSAMHHPAVWWWCWAALALWIGERLWRSVWWLSTNSYLGGMLPAASCQNSTKSPTRNAPTRSEAWEMDHLNSPTSAYNVRAVPKLEVDVHAAREQTKIAFGASGQYVPPPGFAYAELLPGRTVRLRLITPGYLPWAPGQHFLLRVPAVSQYTTHPFTNATVCDQEAPTDEGRELVFLIRAKNGWTKRLWDTIAQQAAQGQRAMRGEQPPLGYDMPNRGVLMRASVDGPFGSAARAKWGAYSTVLLVAGGSGISFALSVLQFLSLCLSGRDGWFLGGRRGGWGQPGFQTRRVRLVWLVREFSHIQWCATLLRRCMAMVPAPELQIDIFVTNAKPLAQSAPQSSQLTALVREPIDEDGFVPPVPQFAIEDHGRSPKSRRNSVSSVESDAESFVDLSYYAGDFNEEGGELGHGEHVLDLTNFEGDDDTAMMGEDKFNLSVKREGRLRRAASRGAAALLSGRKRASDNANADANASGSSQTQNPSTVRLVTAPRHSEEEWTPVSLIEETPRDDSLHPPAQGYGGADYSPPSPISPTSPLSASSQRTLVVPDYAAPPKARMSGSSSPAGTFMSRPMSTASQISIFSDAGSLAALVSEIDVGQGREHLRLDLDEQELQDVGLVAEHARPGKPKLDRILADEVARASGPIIVGCCGPLSLNAVMRKNIAAQIDPERIRRGDMSGSITLFSEDFEY